MWRRIERERERRGWATTVCCSEEKVQKQYSKRRGGLRSLQLVEIRGITITITVMKRMKTVSRFPSAFSVHASKCTCSICLESSRRTCIEI